jgi:hypothetical protein
MLRALGLALISDRKVMDGLSVNNLIAREGHFLPDLSFQGGQIQRHRVELLMGQKLRYMVEPCELALALLAFSLGRISDREVMEQLNVEHEEDLFLLMEQAHLPMPRLPDQATEAMVATLQQLI